MIPLLLLCAALMLLSLFLPKATAILRPSRSYAALAVAVFGLLAIFTPDLFAAAAIDTDVQNIIDTFELTWADIKTAIIAILLFVIGWKLVKRWLKG